MIQATECMAPIIIHQVGKVASQTIERTLRRALPNAPIFRTHILSKQGCDSFRKRVETLLKLGTPQKCQEAWLHQLQRGEQLRRQIERYKKLVGENFVKQKINVVTLTREPVALAIAAFFQSLMLFFPNIESRSETEPTNKLVAEVRDYYLDCVRSFLVQQVAKHSLGFLSFHTIRSLVSGFFDEELKPVFEIDIFATPFDHDRGYQIYEGKYARVLLMRLENLNENVHKAFREFLGLEELKLVNDNQASQKFYKDIYSEFKDTICLPEAFVDLHYDCKFARHFYSPQELAAFRKKWIMVGNPADSKTGVKEEQSLITQILSENPQLAQCLVQNKIVGPAPISEVQQMTNVFETLSGGSKVKCYFITGTGWCGTKLFAKLFSLSRNSVCEHEKLFRHISTVKFYRDNDCSSYLEDINSHVVPKVKSYVRMNKSYGISSGHLYFSIYYLYRVFGRSARFILLVRRPEEFVRSALARGFFDPDHPNSCMQIFPNPADDMFDKWAVTSPFEKCLWYWRLVNQFVLNEFRRMPKDIYKIVRIEDVNVGLVKQLCEFLELSDIRTEAIEATLAQRVNASPGLGDESDVNPYSLPLPLEPVERWDTSQLELLESYTGKLREQLYGWDFPLKGLCDGKVVVKRLMLIRPWKYHDEMIENRKVQ